MSARPPGYVAVELDDRSQDGLAPSRQAREEDQPEAGAEGRHEATSVHATSIPRLKPGPGAALPLRAVIGRAHPFRVGNPIAQVTSVPPPPVVPPAGSGTTARKTSRRGARWRLRAAS